MLVKRRILVALAFADAGALLMTRRTPASWRRPQLQARADADACLRETGVDAVMSATGLMENPRLFDTAGGVVDRSHESLEGRVSLAFEYLKHAAEYPDGCLPRMVSDHLLAILRPELARHPRLRKRIKDYAKNGSVPQQAELVLRVAASRRPL